MKALVAAVAVLGLVATPPGCAGSDGKDSRGTQPLDCGEHGSVHNGHCHCDAGYLFDGAGCVLPDDIDVECETHAEHEGDDHDHGACRCPAVGTCACDGQVQDFGGQQYCAPELHAE